MEILIFILSKNFSLVDVMIISLVGILFSNKKWKIAIVIFLVLGFIKSLIEILLGM